MISDAQLDNLVERLMSDHGTLVGNSLISRHLQSLGLRVQRDRIRESNRLVSNCAGTKEQSRVSGE